MSTTENRKSMDDVLASIRRIVRSEKQPEAEVVDADDGPMPQEVTSGASESPLELTSDMRMAEGPDHAAIAETIVPPRMDASDDAPSQAPAAPSMDADAIKALIKDVVTEEIANGTMNGLVRDVIRDELTTGQIGGNISKNVLRLVQSEIGKAMQK